MDIQLILGSNNSGKSALAEKLVTEMSGCPRIYLATMVSQNEENDRRIEKHLKQREGKEFVTIEEPWDIHTISIPKDSVVLLEDVSNLLANGIFMFHSDFEEAFRRIMTLAKRCQKLVIVSISGFSEEEYEEETRNYIQQLNLLNTKLKEICDKITETY